MPSCCGAGRWSGRRSGHACAAGAGAGEKGLGAAEWLLGAEVGSFQQLGVQPFEHDQVGVRCATGGL